MIDEIKKLLKHTTIYGMGNVLGKMVGFIMIPFYTHYLTTGDYGVLELLDLTLSLTGLVLTMWMNVSIIRHYYEYEDEHNRSQVVGTVGITAAVIGVAVAAFGLCFARNLASFILKTPAFYTYIQLISVSFFFSCIIAVNSSFLRAKQRSLFLVSTDLINLVLSLGLNIYFIAFRKVGLVGVLYSSLIASVVIAAILTSSTLRQIKLRFSFAKLKKIAAFGAPLVFTSVAAFTVNFSDRFFLRHFGSISEVGIYALGYKFGFMLSFLVVQPFDMIWSARMYEVAKREDGPEVISRLFSYYSLVLIAAGLAMSLVIKEVIDVMSTSAFHGAYKIVPLVLLAYIFQGMNRYLRYGIFIAKRTLYLGIIGAISAAANLVLNYFLIGRYGMMGGAMATALSFLLMAVLSFAASQKLLPVPYRFGRLIMPLALAAVVYMASTLVSGPLVVALAIKMSMFLLFPAGLYLMGFFETQEVEKARELARTVWLRYGLGAAAASSRG